MTKEELKRNILFTPHYRCIIHGSIGGLKLCMEIDVFNNHINWIVAEGDHEKDFLDDLDAALDYYEKCGGFDE